MPPEISPFADFVNFTADFTVAGASLEPDEWGNLKPTRDVIVVTAVMEPATLSQQYRRPRDLNERSAYLGGFLVSPRPLPALITPDSPCVAVYNGLTGIFVYEFEGRDPFLQALNIDLVDRIKGWFVPSSFVSAPP